MRSARFGPIFTHGSRRAAPDYHYSKDEFRYRTPCHHLSDASCHATHGLYNKRVLDFGTGTGILAILAEKMGAAHITAIDNDAWSFENVQENLQLNACTRIITAHTATIPTNEKYDVILANITRDVLIEYMPLLRSCLKPGAALLCSGILKEDKHLMLAEGENWGMKLVQERERENWISLLFVN
jgi:ribosomal protein L11 methyltransferase